MAGGYLAGIYSGFVLLFIGLLAHFVRAWWVKRDEAEYLLMGATSGALACYTAGIAVFYVGTVSDDWLWWVRRGASIATVGAIVTMALNTHFAVRFSRLASERLVMLSVYGMALIFAIALALGLWWERLPTGVVQVQLLGVLVPAIPLVPSVYARVFYVLVVISAVASAGLIGRAYLRGRTDGLAAFVGSVVLAVAAANDAVLGIGNTGVFLGPLGFLAFAFAVDLTLVTRFGVLWSELLRRSEELRKRSRDLRHANLELRRTQEEMVRKEQLAVVGELAAVVAHEVRNPLAVISNAAAGLRKDTIGVEDRAALLTIVEEETARINRLVGDLLRYSRPVTVQRAPVSLPDLLERSLSLVDRQSIEVKFQCSADSGHVMADASLLRQVFDNLVGNAVQAMAGVGLLTVTITDDLQQSERGISVVIGDTGEGMDTMVRSRARTPFFTTRPSGTGLGLAIVDRIIEAHGGTMTLESRPGEGTTVTVYLPLGEDGR